MKAEGSFFINIPNQENSKRNHHLKNRCNLWETGIKYQIKKAPGFTPGLFLTINYNSGM